MPEHINTCMRPDAVLFVPQERGGGTRGGAQREQASKLHDKGGVFDTRPPKGCKETQKRRKLDGRKHKTNLPHHEHDPSMGCAEMNHPLFSAVAARSSSSALFPPQNGNEFLNIRESARTHTAGVRLMTTVVDVCVHHG